MQKDKRIKHHLFIIFIFLIAGLCFLNKQHDQINKIKW